MPSSRWSPATWPRLSFTTLKRSMSRKNTANADPRSRLPIDQPAQAIEEQQPVGQAGQRIRPARRQLGLDARQRDREIDRLGDVVVGAETERLDDVLALIARRHHDHRQIGERAGLANAAQHVEAVHAGHHHVEQHEIEVAARSTSASAVGPSAAVVTRKPRRSSRRDSMSRFSGLSSTTSSRPRSPPSPGSWFGARRRESVPPRSGCEATAAPARPSASSRLIFAQQPIELDRLGVVVVAAGGERALRDRRPSRARSARSTGVAARQRRPP